MTDTLLAHLSGGFSQGKENLATDALEYVLKHDEIADAFQRHLRRFAPDLPKLTRFKAQTGSEEDSGIRDLVGRTMAGTSPLVVEVKFWARLTHNQPAAYLRALVARDEPGLLLFLVPTIRARTLWPQLLQRCSDDGLKLEPGEGSDLVATIGPVTLAVGTWGQLLDDLSGIPLSPENQQVLGEISQLRGLVSREDREGFRPFELTFLESDAGRSLVEVLSLIHEAANLLRREGTATAKVLKWSSGRAWMGKNFRLRGRSVYLHVNFLRWGNDANTPLWLWVKRWDPLVADALNELRNDQPPRLFDADGWLQIPIGLSPGADREECLNEVLTTIRRVHDLLPPAASAPIDDDDDVDEDEADFEAE